MTADNRSHSRPCAVFFGSDGMRHDLMARYAAAGEMPVLHGLMERGISGESGCLPALPTNTGSGWATLATGAWSGTSGALNNTYHTAGTPITTPTSGFNSLLNGAETLAQAAERQGLTTASVEWPGTTPATCTGPVVDFRTFYSLRGALLKADPPDYDAGVAARQHVSDQRHTFPLAIGWENVPHSALPAHEAVVAVRSTRPMDNPDRVYNVYVYATSAAGYDRILIAEGKDGIVPVCDLRAGEWAEVRVQLTEERRAGFHFKLIEMRPDLTQVWLYFTSVSRSRADPPELEELLASSPFAVPETADHGPAEAGLIDPDTYVEQGLMFYSRVEHVYRHIIETYHPDLLFAGAPVTDEFSHQFMALTTPAYPNYDPLTAPRYENYLRQAYAGADRLLGFILGLYPTDVIAAVSADHGFGAAWLSINANLVLARAGLLVFDGDGQPSPQSSAVAYWAGGTCNIYVNLAGREPDGTVPAAQFEPVRQRIIAAFDALNSPTDPAIVRVAPGGRLIDVILRFEETNAVPTSCGPATMQFAGRTGDVVVFAAPPAQFDAPDPGSLVSPSPLHGQHGYLPDTVNADLNVNMRPPLILAGPGVRRGGVVRGGRAVDIAPTLAALLGITPPANADGQILIEALTPAD